jgi:hypothetical protein
VDSTANLTVEAGNFCPPTQAWADSLKAQTFIAFFKRLNYDAVALGGKELGFSFDLWKDATRNGLPVLAANLFYKGNVLTYPNPDKAVFDMPQVNHRADNGQYFIREDHGCRLGVIGFVSPSAWKARKDTLARGVAFKSPFDMHSLVRDVAHNCDHLTIIGDFTMQEAESLYKTMPEINLIVGSNIRIDQSVRHGRTVIVGLPPRGNSGNYVEWNLATHDSADATTRTVSLDTGAPEDSSVAKLLSDYKDKTTGPAPQPAKPLVTPPAKPVTAPPAKAVTAPAPNIQQQAISKPATVIIPSAPAPSNAGKPPVPANPDGSKR